MQRRQIMQQADGDNGESQQENANVRGRFHEIKVIAEDDKNTR
jgi:hypothetical protein